MTAPRVLVMTPSRGTCAMGYHKSILAVAQSRLPGVYIDTMHNWPEDVCLVRARMAHYAWREKYDRVFFWDSDVSMSVEMFLAIATSPHEFAAGLYMNSRGKIPFLGELKRAGDWAVAEAVPLGAACISRKVLGSIGNSPFLDVMPDSGEEIWTPDLFAHLRDVHGHRQSEDYSFCQRAVEAGYPPHVYTGDTATHWKMVPLKA